MRVLVLVDLDQCFVRTDDLDTVRRIIGRCFNPKAEPLLPQVDSVVVVLAFNTSTARALERRFGGTALADFARSFAEVVAGPGAMVNPEFAMTLTMPEAADVALAALAKGSPTQANSGAFDRVVLLSNDKGLRQGVGSTMNASFTALGDEPMRKKGATWVAAPKVQRAHTVLAATTGCPVAPDSGSPTVLVDTSSLAAWAWTRLAEVPVGTCLGDLAGMVAGNPSILTQVGITRIGGASCVRGVDRLTQYLTSGNRPSLGPCCPSDGLELTYCTPLPARWCFDSTSPVAPGAIRLRTAGTPYRHVLTASTKVPPWVFSPSLPIQLEAWNPRRIKDRLSLLAHFNSVPPERPTCTFVRTDRHAQRPHFCELDRDDFMQPPTTWWWIAAGPGTAKLKLNLPEIELARTIRDVPCEASLSPSGDLGYRSIGGTAGEVDCPEGLTAGTIGLGVSQGQHLAVLALSHVTRGRRVTVRPIQDVSWSDIREKLGTMGERQWDDLRLLPLLVAEDVNDEQPGPVNG
jgi:hypothetical protein